MPQFTLAEVVMGQISSRNMLFYPKNAQLSDTENNEVRMIELRGFTLRGGKREPITQTIKKTTNQACIYFALHLSDAYMGRLFAVLSTLISLKHTQN